MRDGCLTSETRFTFTLLLLLMNQNCPKRSLISASVSLVETWGLYKKIGGGLIISLLCNLLFHTLMGTERQFGKSTSV